MTVDNDDLTSEQYQAALDQTWAAPRADGGGSNLLARMRDSIASLDTSDDKPRLTKEEFLAELARSKG